MVNLYDGVNFTDTRVVGEYVSLLVAVLEADTVPDTVCVGEVLTVRVTVFVRGIVNVGRTVFVTIETVEVLLFEIDLVNVVVAVELFVVETDAVFVLENIDEADPVDVIV